MWWKDVLICFSVLCILHLRFDICDDIRVVSISINGIMIIMMMIIVIIILIMMMVIIIIIIIIIAMIIN